MYSISGHLCLGITLAVSFRSAYSASAQRTASSQDWAALNKTVGGRLAVGVPWSKPCFSLFNGNPVQADPAACELVQASYFNTHLARTDAFGAWSAVQWESCMASGDSCQLDSFNATNPLAFTPPAQCKQGGVPNHYIDVKDKDDVIAGLKFAKMTGVPLVVKNTGHDFQGRSSAPGALALWTHHLKQISHDAKFIPEQCPPSTTPVSTITVGAGSQFQDIYQFADANNLVVVGGSDQSVGGSGGWVLGGGHSALSHAYGLGVDRVVQFKVVTPDGVYRVANACENQDLFFALRGGGGTFGVVLETTMLASPRTSLRVANINWNITDDNYAGVLKVFIDNATTFANQGWGGYISPGNGNAVFVTPKLNLQEAEASMQALLDVTATMGETSTVTEVDSFLEWFELYVQGKSGAQDVVGTNDAISSRLIPQKNHATPESRAELLNATLAATKTVFFSQIHFTTPYGFTGKIGDTSASPAWRTSLWHMIMINIWNFDATLADKQQAYAGASTAANFMRKITPGSGAYHNEADIHEPNHEVSFWGVNYPRLVQIKKKYDPDHILDCWNCVGWKGPNDPRFSCYI